MADFDGLRGSVAAGDGVVARFPGIVCVAKSGDADAIHLRRLLELCREASGDAPGRALARRLASWLSGPDGPSDELRFGTLAATDKGLAVFLVGAVSMAAAEAGVTVSGTDAAAWADRLLPQPDSPVSLALDGASVAADLAASVHDLHSGVVPGVGIVLASVDVRPASPAVPAAARPVLQPIPPTAEPAVQVVPEETQPPVLDQPTVAAPPPAPGPDPASQPRPPRRADSLSEAPTELARPPLEIAGEGGRQANGEASDGDLVVEQPAQAHGHLCSRGHLNDPRSHFCVLCGIRMNQQTGVIVLGARPPLGLLVFDDGTTYTVDAEYLIGRMPETDDRVISGELRSIAIEDPSGAVSRVHAEVRLNNWDVLLVDSGSRNGTFLAAPGEETWTPMPPRESVRLTPGMRARIGGRTFVFESPSGVR